MHQPTSILCRPSRVLMGLRAVKFLKSMFNRIFVTILLWTIDISGFPKSKTSISGEAEANC